jgi:hypothetical protein
MNQMQIFVKTFQNDSIYEDYVVKMSLSDFLSPSNVRSSSKSVISSSASSSDERVTAISLSHDEC